MCYKTVSFYKVIHSENSSIGFIQNHELLPKEELEDGNCEKCGGATNM